MDNRLIFLYLMEIAQECHSRIWRASVQSFGSVHVLQKGEWYARSGVTEWEHQSVCIDCTWNI